MTWGYLSLEALNYSRSFIGPQIFAIIILSHMKLTVLVLTLALASVAFAGILAGPYHTPNPNDIWKKVHFSPLRTLDYAEPAVEVALAYITYGFHGVAYNKVKLLFPRYAIVPVWRCHYVALGLTRFYTFTFKIAGQVKEVNAAVETQEDQDASAGTSADHQDGFLKVSVEWAQEDPRISAALGYTLKQNWQLIGGRPLIACFSKPVAGLYVYRFYFKDVNGKFEYSESSERKDPKVLAEGAKSYFTEAAPVLALTKSDSPQGYVEYMVSELRSHPAFPKIKELFEQELGFLDENWIVKYAGVGGKSGNVMKLILNFKPFLLQQHYEAYYYGDVEKASLLKVDEKIFDAGNSFEKWQQIENFSKFNAFQEAHEYILSQFSWLRLYEVESAYAALHKKGRFIRLVYKGVAENNIDPGQQINIIAYLDERGCYFIDRNDFHATHLNSYGRNEWVSLFVETPEVSQAKYYQRIVKFHKDIYPKFWFANQLEDIKFKGDLHVIKFKNPTNERYNVLLINDKETKVMNKVDWTKLPEDSPLIDRIENYVRGKYADCGSIMFIQFMKNEKGTHFEVSFMTKANVYRAVYVLYIADTDVFTHNTYYSFKSLTYGKHPLPQDVQASVVAFLAAQEQNILAVTALVSLSPSSFAIIGITESGRWQITLEWQEGEWVIVSKQPYKDGFHKAKGYPSAAVAAASGFLKKLYPQQFGEGYVYASIETKNVGVAVSIRLVFKFKGLFIEATVSKVYGVKSSHVLQSWRIVNGLNEKEDYGYGVNYSYSYNVPAELLYKDNEPVKPERSPVARTMSAKPRAGGCPEGSRRSIFGPGCVILF